jgi:hypothetical protein
MVVFFVTKLRLPYSLENRGKRGGGNRGQAKKLEIGRVGDLKL